MDGSIQRFLAALAAVVAVFAFGVCGDVRPARADPLIAPEASTGPSHPTALPPPLVRAVPASDVVFVATAAQPDDFVPPPPPPPDAVPEPMPVEGVPMPAEEAPLPLDTDFPAAAPGEAVPPAWSTPAPVSEPLPAAPLGAPCPPPAAPVVVPCPAPCPAPVPLAARTWSGCRLPCEDKISMWHVRLVGGIGLYEGDDAPDECLYWGTDVGRTFCGCWGLDAYYRYSSGRFERNDRCRSKDGGWTHHLGGKLTWERSFGNNSRFYYWLGAGAGYFMSEDYDQDDEGFEVFGEIGLGYVLSENFRVRAGLNAHGFDTAMGNVGQPTRWLWLLAPVLELEVDF